MEKGWNTEARLATSPILPQNSNPPRQAPAPLESPGRRPGWAQLGLECGRVQKAVESHSHTSRAYHDHHFGSGALNLPLYDAKPLAVHFQVPPGMGAASARVPQPRQPVGPASATQKSGCHGAPRRAIGRWVERKLVQSPWRP